MPLLLHNYLKIDPKIGYDIVQNSPRETEGVDNIPYDVWSNNIGCFDNPYNGEEVAALLVGDSFAWGFAPFEDKWGKVIEDEVGGRVLKCGVLGYGTKQELLKTEEVLKKTKKPQLIIVGYFVNDLGDDYVFPEATIVNGVLSQKYYLADVKKGGVAEVTDEELSLKATKEKEGCAVDYLINPFIKKVICLAENFKLYKVFKEPLKKLALKVRGENEMLALVPQIHKSFWQLGMLAFLPQDKYPWIKSVWETHFLNIKGFKELAKREGVELLFVMIPLKESVYPFLSASLSPFVPKEIDLNNLRKTLRPFLEKEKISYVDLLPLMQEYANEKPRSSLDPKEDLYYKKDGHWTSKGNRLVGLLVSRHILQNNLLPLAAELKEKTLKDIEKKLKEFKP
jgi:hypothetical protein